MDPKEIVRRVLALWRQKSKTMIDNALELESQATSLRRMSALMDRTADGLESLPATKNIADVICKSYPEISAS